MESSPEIDAFVAECETRLRCQYVRPDCVRTLPAATRLTRYLFPMSLDALGVRAPNEVVQLLLVANTAPRWLWEEVEEAFEASAYTVSVMKSETGPMCSVAAVPTLKMAAKTSNLRAAVGGRTMLLEYCQHVPIEDLIDSNGHFSARSASGSHLIQKAYWIQQAERDPEILRAEANRCLRWAHDYGMVSERLDLLSPEQVYAMRQQLHDNQVNKDSVVHQLWELFAKRAGVSPRRQVPQGAHSKAPESPGDGFELFAKSHSQFVLIELHCWAPGMRLLLADDFFDVVAAAQHKIQASGSHSARAWPFHLTELAAEDGVACFLIGIWRTGDEYDCISEESIMADKVSQLAADLLAKSIRPHMNNEYATQVALIDRDHYIFANSKAYSHRHVAPVRGLPTAALLPKLDGDTSTATSEHTSETHLVDGKAGDEISAAPASFRTEKKILDQLRWDDKYAGARSYEVGYVDRFADVLMWLPIEDWVQITEEEEFIPLHRIRQFRNILSKEVIWDRALRIDKLK